MDSKAYGAMMRALVRCGECHDPLEAYFVRPRGHETGDVIVEVWTCEKCAKKMVAEDAALDAEFAASKQGGE